MEEELKASKSIDIQSQEKMNLLSNLSRISMKQSAYKKDEGAQSATVNKIGQRNLASRISSGFSNQKNFKLQNTATSQRSRSKRKRSTGKRCKSRQSIQATYRTTLQNKSLANANHIKSLSNTRKNSHNQNSRPQIVHSFSV